MPLLRKNLSKYFSNTHLYFSTSYQIRYRSIVLIVSLYKSDYGGLGPRCMMLPRRCKSWENMLAYAARGVIVGWECRAWGCDPRSWPDPREASPSGTYFCIILYFCTCARYMSRKGRGSWCVGLRLNSSSYIIESLFSGNAIFMETAVF